ncbi:MAG: hypothetical protein MUC43_02920 [Pirellula sp.]|jgi:hypothetical protein|nr:hypothetical protein [Pirellula sp.]
MEIIFMLLGFIVFVVLFAAVGHVVWVILASIVRFLTGTPQQPPSPPSVNSPETDLAQSYLAIDRLFRGKLISAESFRQSCEILETAAAKQGFELPWIPAKRVADSSVATVSELESSPVLATPQDAGRALQPIERDVIPSEIHALDKQYSPSAPPLIDTIASQTRRTLGNVLQQFLNEKNIHWGELVSALLIVGSAVGLILSLRTELNRLIPMFPSVLFFLITLAIHLAGFYTLKRWKLPSTSRGLLILGSIMMCVTSLATVLLTEQSSAPVSDWVPLLLGLVGFGTLSFLSSASLFPGMRPMWTVAVTTSGIAPLILSRWLEPEVVLDQLKWGSNAAVLGPFFAVIGSVVLHFAFPNHARSISLRSQLRLFGITFVGALFSGGLILFLLKGAVGGVSSLSLMFSVLGGLLVCAGSIMSFKSQDIDSRSQAELSESLLDRVTVIGSAVSFLGAGVMVFSIGSAWSSAPLFLETACLNAVVSFVLVLLWRTPTLTAIASAFGTISCWLLVQRVSGEFPTSSMRLDWLIRAIGTVRSSGTFLVLAGSFSILALRTPRMHKFILLIAAAWTSVAGLGVAGYLGCTATTLGPHVYAIMCFALVGLVVALIGPITGRMEPAIIGSSLILFAWSIIARPETILSDRLGINSFWVVDQIVYTLSGHAITTVLIAAVVSLLRIESIGSRFLPFIVPRLQEPRMERWISDSGLVSAAVCIPFLIRVAPTLDWLWQASLLALLAFGCGIGWLVGRGTNRESLGWFALGCSICFFVADGINRFYATGVLGRSSLSIAIACVFLLGTICAIFLSRPTRIARSTIKIKSWSTIHGDGLLIVISFLFFAYWIVEARDWWQSVLYSRSNARIWTTAVLLFFGCAIALTACRKRSLYIWLTGGMSTFVVFTLVGIWSTQGGDEVAFAYLLLGAPQLVAGIANAIDLLQRKQPVRGFAAKGRYETVVAIFTILFWALATCVGFFGNIEDPNTRACGLWSLVGGIWVAIGLVSFWLASHVVHRRQFIIFLLVGTFIVSWNLPTAIARVFATKLEAVLALSLALVGIAMQIVVTSWFVLQGFQVSSFVQRILRTSDRATASDARRVCWTYANLMSLCVGLLSLLVAMSTTNSEGVRLLALAAALLAFANGILVRRESHELLSDDLPMIPAVFNRYLMVIFASLFMLLVVWARLEYVDATVLFTSRVLRTATIMIATTLGISVAYAWLSRHHTISNTSLESRRESWPETLGRIWIGATTLAITFLIIGFATILITTNQQLQIIAELISRNTFATESLWIAVLAGAWSVQLIVQAVRANWNIARFSKTLRGVYVYIAEVVVVLAASILVSIFPEWFRLPMREYWPILMLITAVIAQGVAVLLKRAGVSAVGDPLHNTSLLLPLIAPLAMFFIGTEATLEMVLALGALFYFFLGATERSRQLAMIGGTFANGALLSFWTKFDSLSFLEHPQLWLIPPAASIVLATHIARDRIPKEAASWLRYLCMATIFCSSSSEILIQGLGRSLWPPMVLMVLSLLVGFLGIAFQIKSYLYSGLLFTLFAIVAMVAHAQQSVQHTWPWWVLGISLGIGIMVLFALFERKRDQLIKLSERLKGWE